MSHRIIPCTLTLVLSTVLLEAQVPRTPDGHPDLQGVWTNATITPLERPKAFAAKPTLSDAEAVEYEKAQAKELNDQDGQSDGPLIAAAGSSGTGGYNVLFIDRGSELARVDGVKRTSLIIDPPDGRIPPLTPQGRERTQALMRSFSRFESVKERPLSERCLIGFGSTAGPPMLPVLYNNNYQIVQTPDAIMILVEMVHDVRSDPHESETCPSATSVSGWGIRSATGKATRWWWIPPTSTRTFASGVPRKTCT